MLADGDMYHHQNMVIRNESLLRELSFFIQSLLLH